MPTLTIDGRQISSPEGSTVIQAAETLGIFVPRYCYHPALSVAGNCRICLVEVEKSPKLQIACNTPVAEGMVVHTKSEKAEDGRRAVLEFLLANHPLDCPVCDQSGECELQNFYMNFGLYDARFREQKVKKKKAVAVGPHVMLDQERCILCSRCVRFTDEITKTGEFGIFNRGDRAELGLYPGQELNNPYSGNVIDVCPVGALTEQDFRFKARVWYLSSAPSVCNGCAQGCNIDVHYVLDRPHLNDGARVMRLKPRYNPDVNQWWMCDEGRFGFHWIDRGRLTHVRDRGTESTWEKAVAAISAELQIACNTPVAEGMVVHTKSEKAEDGRRAVLEFLLANHPLDCPVCDQSGECDLQNFYMNFGLYDPRFREQKVKKKKAVAHRPARDAGPGALHPLLPLRAVYRRDLQDRRVRDF